LGLGHASRTLALGKRLEAQGHKVSFFSGGKAYQLLQRAFKNVYPCTPVAWYENAHGILASASVINILFPLPFFDAEKQQFGLKSSSAMQTIHRYYDLRQHIKEIRPDVLVSDGDIHALRLSHRWRIPCVYITNIIRPSYGFSSLLNPGERFTERYVKNCLRIIVPDNPPPYTISEYNIGDLDRIGIGDKVEFVGSFVEPKSVKGSEEHIFAPISGPLGTRNRLTRMLLPVFGELDARSIVSLGIPGIEKTTRLKNCEVHTWLSAREREEFIQNARFVVFSGGHTTCFEIVRRGKPCIIVPTQPEQLGNALKLQNTNCGLVAKNTRQLRLAVRTIEEKRAGFRKNVEELNRFSNRFDGLGRATRIIEEIVD
jgi:uncharacterized protein (TIGR00661 family)